LRRTGLAFKKQATVDNTAPKQESAMIQTQGFLHITIGVTDLDRATAFYRDMLGCELIRQNGKKTMSFMKTGDDLFVLTHTGVHQRPNQKGPVNIDTTLFHHAFLVTPAELDSALDHFKANGIEYFDCTPHGHTTFPGRRHVYIMDPDGNSVELATTITGE
jgi:catechol 2,3-dioxygenase-like lactoylglutathione lyase family enzyme